MDGMPESKVKAKRRKLPQRQDAIPNLPGVNFEDALRAAMATPIPKDWKPPVAKHKRRKKTSEEE